MILVRPAEERGHGDHGWLDTRHTFSFADYWDPGWTGFRTLRVLNEDRVAPGAGFPTHGHRDMEIISYVLAGALEHRDSLGHGSVIRPGDVQRMSAGTGVRHREDNPSPEEPVHFLQIWILPARAGLSPSYEQKAFTEAERRDRLRLIASSDGHDGSVTVHQDVAVYAGILGAGTRVAHRLADGRHGWLQIAHGAVLLGGHALATGDGAAATAEPALTLEATAPSEILLFDLA